MVMKRKPRWHGQRALGVAAIDAGNFAGFPGRAADFIDGLLDLRRLDVLCRAAAERGGKVVGADEQRIDAGRGDDGVDIAERGRGLDHGERERALIGLAQVFDRHGASAIARCGPQLRSPIGILATVMNCRASAALLIIGAMIASAVSRAKRRRIVERHRTTGAALAWLTALSRDDRSRPTARVAHRAGNPVRWFRDEGEASVHQAERFARAQAPGEGEGFCVIVLDVFRRASKERTRIENTRFDSPLSRRASGTGTLPLF
jgi:hypothetical protein